MQIAKNLMLKIVGFYIFLLCQNISGENLKQGLHRHIRSLSFPETNNMGIFFAVAIPIDLPDKSVSVSFYFEANYGMPAINNSFIYGPQYEKRSIDRRVLYDVIENKLESYGYAGRACLLRTICESAKFPFAKNGLVGDIVRIIFAPSSSQKENLHPDIEEAEYLENCMEYHEKCPINLLDLITHELK